ncbi:ABC transporter substrate-binding protein [Nocardioides sp. SYSU D00038]|uniref:ABC transporter substrate-binding protein n=1 Tax=Nocardioides sp. SYSU D00038 TaxID=2812554 RepID=UPI0019678C55|nr:sugar ABC transporter substrate-binding protein [Nocardioides sp. SYSU D00038]
MTSRRFRRIASVAALATIASLGLAACGGSDDGPEQEPKGEGPGPVEQPAEPTTVTFFSWLGNNPEWKKLADEFHAEYPNITIKFENVPAEQAAQVLSTRIAGNNAPDVAYVNASDVADYASRSAAVDLVNYIDRSEVVDPDDYVEAFRQFVTYDEKLWGLPMGGETTGLFYRTDLFEEAGIDGPPATWEEFEETAAALTDESANRYGFEVFAPESAYYFQPWLYQAGGDLMSPDGKEIAFNSDEARTAAEFYVNLAKYAPKDYLNSNSWDGRVAFAEGQVGMYMAGAWFAGTLTEEFPDIEGKWATAPLPEGEAGCKTTIAGDSLVMMDQTKNPDAAWLWMEFLSRPDVLARTTYETEGTLLPPLTSLLEGPEIVEKKPVLQGFIDLMECGVAPTASNPKWPRIETILNEELGKAMYGDQTAGEALDNTAQQAEAILARN